MIISGKIPTDNRVAINESNIRKIATLIEKTLDRTVTDATDILYAPKTDVAIKAFYSNVDSILTNRFKNKFAVPKGVTYA